MERTERRAFELVSCNTHEGDQSVNSHVMTGLAAAVVVISIAVAVSGPLATDPLATAPIAVDGDESVSSGSPVTSNPVEVGYVGWGRDLNAALATSKESGRPVFLLFQEVPGCTGCREFGQTVLTHPLMVEAIEDEFIPVLVYNNVVGKDERIREQFKEPAWNFQVVRFLDGSSKDVIPRKDKVWTIGALAGRMVQALEARSRPVPRYLHALEAEFNTDRHASGAFAQHCFWIGEAKLGGIEGVVMTEAGWIEEREVTRVVFDRDKIDIATLAAKARAMECADKVYAPEDQRSKLAAAASQSGLSSGELTGDYRRAKLTDQKHQILSWPEIHKLPGITEMQKTKINALAKEDRSKALAWLSPRQRAALLTSAKPKALQDG